MIARLAGLAILLLVVGFIAGLYMLNRAIDDSAVPYSVATILPEPRSLPSFTLTDNTNREFRTDDLAGGWDLVFFGFTSCGDICPTTMLILSSVAQSFDRPPRVVFLSVDPGRDTLDRLDVYVRTFGPDVIGVTGDDEQIRIVSSALGAAYFVPDEAENYMVEHTRAVFLIDPEGRFVGVITSPDDPELIAADLRHLMES